MFMCIVNSEVPTLRSVKSALNAWFCLIIWSETRVEVLVAESPIYGEHAFRANYPDLKFGTSEF